MKLITFIKGLLLCFKINISLMIFPLILLSCKSKDPYREKEYLKNLQEANIKFFKIQAYCSCLENAYVDKDIIKRMQKEDLMGSFDGIAEEVIQKTIDSIGKSIASTIKPEEYEDFEGKKTITEKCLEFYTSKKLDSIAKQKFKIRNGKMEFTN